MSSGSNPFSTRYVRPGSLDYRFPEGLDARAVVQRFAAVGARAQIIGPHGTGKSTLLASLAAPLEADGWRVMRVTLREGQRLPRPLFPRLPRDPARPLLIVDGFEQLSKWRRWWVPLACRRRGWGLLVTSHGDVGLPTLCRTHGDIAVFVELVERLCGGQPPFAERDLRACLTHHRGNVREALFDLYDRFESRRGAPNGTTTSPVAG